MPAPPIEANPIPPLGVAGVRISACILAKNEASNIEAAIQSLLGWTDQIIVLDNESTDATAAIASSYGALVVKVVNPNKDGNFDALRNLANDFATGDWIFFLDADERVPQRLGPMLRQIVATRGNEFEALVLPFKHFFCGRWMQHCGWWPGYKSAPLLKKGTFRHRAELHMGVEINGRTRGMVRRRLGESRQSDFLTEQSARLSIIVTRTICPCDTFPLLLPFPLRPLAPSCLRRRRL